MIKTPTAPKHLSKDAKTLWRSILAEYDLQVSEQTILKTALENYDRMQLCRQQIANEGATILTPTGMQKPHPALQAEKNATSAYLQSMRLLNFNEEPPNPVGRPPGRK